MAPKNAVIKINYPGSGNNSQFIYNAGDFLVKILETSGGTITNTKQFIWALSELAESRDATSGLLNQFFDRGQIISGTNYFYTKDHVGSVRELLDNTSTLKSQYSYDPYGRVTYAQENPPSDYRYASYYVHTPSQLYVPFFRFYNPAQGRWINRDPMGERGGINLFAYVRNKPISKIDPTGLVDSTDYSDCSRKCSDGSPCKVVRRAIYGSKCVCPGDPIITKGSPDYNPTVGNDYGLLPGNSFEKNQTNEQKDLDKEFNLFNFLKGFHF